VSGTSLQINGGEFQSLEGNYTITVANGVGGIGGIGQADPYPTTAVSTIAFKKNLKCSMTQRITSIVNHKKDGFTKYIPASGNDPATGNWQIVGADSRWSSIISSQYR
jgi:hypothetical protein